MPGFITAPNAPCNVFKLASLCSRREMRRNAEVAQCVIVLARCGRNRAGHVASTVDDVVGNGWVGIEGRFPDAEDPEDELVGSRVFSPFTMLSSTIFSCT